MITSGAIPVSYTHLIFSLPSDFGIGTLGRDACDFIDFLAAADVHVWEIMPICHTDSSFSPHNALCARAGNPLLIDLQPFVDQGVFSSRELSRMDWGRDRAKISYSKVAAAKYKALEMVFDALGSLPDSSQNCCPGGQSGLAGGLCPLCCHL